MVEVKSAVAGTMAAAVMWLSSGPVVAKAGRNTQCQPRGPQGIGELQTTSLPTT